MAIDFQGLFQVLKAGEKFAEHGMLIMSKWECGTAGCLIGSFCHDNKNDVLDIYQECPIPYPYLKQDPTGYISLDLANRFGITEREVKFLFISSHLKNNDIKNHACNLSSERALARLRKFLYYKLHKQEMEYEEARRVDGNKAAIHAAKADNTELPVMYDKLLVVC